MCVEPLSRNRCTNVADAIVSSSRPLPIRAAGEVAACTAWATEGSPCTVCQVQLRAFFQDQPGTKGSWVAETNSEYADVLDMFRRLTTLDEESIEYRRQRDMIVDRCLPLADHIARRFSNRGEPFEDLLQVARVGLINAVNRFDAEKGAGFVGFAVPTIMGEVRRYFRDHGWSVQVPRRFKELSSQLNRAREQLSQQLGRAPTATEIASHLGLDRDLVVQAQVASSAYSTWSTDAPAVAGGDGDRRAVSDSFGSFDANLEKVLDIETVRPLLEALPEREQTVLRLRFFENMTQTQIAKRLGISQMHVSRLLARSLTELRQAVRTPELV
jgi:RNA polymerase sigma-B factor